MAKQVELPPKYTLPAKWTWDELGKYSNLLSGYPFKSSMFSTDSSDASLPVVRIRDVMNGFSSTFTAENCPSEYRIHNGNILIGMDGDFNINKWKSGDALLNQRVCLLKIDASSHVLENYVYYYLPIALKYINDNTPSVTVKHLSVKTLKEIPIPLPPLPEQQRIVSRIESLFTKLDAARDKLQQVLDTQETRRAAILHEAFTGRLTGHKGSAECRGKREKEGAQNPEGTEFVPEGWKRVKFSDIAEVKSNLVSPQDYQDFPHIAPDNIEKATGRLLSYHTIKEDKVTSPKHRFYPGQILYSKIRPYLSKVVIVDFDGLCSADMYPIETTENTRYLWYYMLSNEFLLQALSGKSRTVLPKINQKELAQIKVLVPPPDEQIVIVEKLDRIFMNEQKNYKIVRYSLSQIDLLKKSILARAFRGQLGTQDPSDPDARDLLTSDQ